MPISTPKEHLDRYQNDEKHFRNVLESLFVPAVKAAGFDPIRPAASGSTVIQSAIIKNLVEAELVLCDMSSLNANVFFELGVRTALDKPVCYVIDEFSSAPFDVLTNQYHQYDANPTWNLDDQVDQLKSHIAETAQASDRNAMWEVFGVQAKASEPTTDQSSLEAKVDALTNTVKSLAGTTMNAPDGIELEVTGDVEQVKAFSEAIAPLGDISQGVLPDYVRLSGIRYANINTIKSLARKHGLEWRIL